MLILYKGINYNTDDQTHAYFTSINAYKLFLEPYKVTTIEKSNYLITEGYVNVVADNIINNYFKEITYIFDDELKIFYFVNDVIYKSNFFSFKVSVDYWGTYISNALLSNLNINRCNRAIGVGVYDNIGFTRTNESKRFTLEPVEQVSGNAYYLKYNKACIVFLLKYARTTEGSWGDITATDMYYIPISQLNDLFAEQKGKVNPVELATAFVGGIAKANLPEEPNTTASVTKAYIVPTSFIEENTNENNRTLISFNKYGKKQTTAIILKHAVKEVKKTLDVNPNYDYYIGTPYDGLKLIRTNETTTKITYRITADVDGLKVVVLQGGNQKDITANFSVALTYNEGDVTGLGLINSGLTTLTGIFSSGLRMAGGDMVGGTLGLGGSIASGLSPFLKTNTQLGHIVGSGDGLINIKANGDLTKGLGLANPLGYMQCLSNDNEKALARHYGITYNDIFNDNFITIFNYLLIGEDETFTDTYIKGSVDVSNVPAIAKNEIKQAFANGVRLKKIV